MAGLTLGSLFDGIGVFPQTGSRYEIIPTWANEVEKAPIFITKVIGIMFFLPPYVSH
ncbi:MULTISPECIES: hypothetical protein [Lysinibacillus]|uniref:hypothetical protein n=1 Tax=Lysinibacillus TaxID=400634 RepID=UPI001F518879|nr:MULTISPECIES: hypothetical protein [Lysinibacillus]